MDAKTCIFCPHGHEDCEWLDQMRHGFAKGVALLSPYRNRGTRAFEDYGKPFTPEFTALHTVGMPGMRGGR